MIKKIALSESDYTYQELNTFLTKLASDNSIAKNVVNIYMDHDEVILKFTDEA